jgi:hypothetical protein
MARERINQLEEQHNSTLETISSMDRLEEESRQAIIHYRERMDEAIKALRNTVEKYRVILGDERVSFESSTLKVLEDLKLSQEKLLKLLPYFPLIRDLSWRPSRVVNDKIYDLEVSLEVISPLNTLAEVEVSLIPVEYEYFITNYGMRREDYPKAFPPEETKTVKIKPAGLEREAYNIEFKDIIGGREYSIRVIAKDVATSVNSEERKTHYIRQYENIAPLDGILVGAFYYPWYGPGRNHWREGYTGTPLLGEYFSGDRVVISKHIDWMTGHGIDFILPSWWGPHFEGYTGQPDTNFKEFLKNPLVQDIRFGLNYESLGRLKSFRRDNDLVIDLSETYNVQRLLDDFNYLRQTYFDSPQLLKIEGKVVTFLYLSRIFSGDVEATIKELRESLRRYGYEIFIIGDLVYWQNPEADSEKARIKIYDAVTAYNMHANNRETLDNFESNVDRKYAEWFRVTQALGIPFIPSILPGYDDRAARPQAGILPLEKSIERFNEQIMIAKKYLSNKVPIILITTFNEWHEFTNIEPSLEDGFSYLRSVRDNLAGK